MFASGLRPESPESPVDGRRRSCSVALGRFNAKKTPKSYDATLRISCRCNDNLFVCVLYAYHTCAGYILIFTTIIPSRGDFSISRREKWSKFKVGLGPSYNALSSSVGQLERHKGKASAAAHEFVEEYVVSASFPRGGGVP